jgi:hypothetical protein
VGCAIGGVVEVAGALSATVIVNAGSRVDWRPSETAIRTW